MLSDTSREVRASPHLSRGEGIADWAFGAVCEAARPQDHPNLAAIFGGSHAGSLAWTNIPAPEARLAFVALENCEGKVPGRGGS